LFAGCAAQSVTTGTKKLSREFVDQNLVKGKTTKADVRVMLGEPQSQVTTDLANHKVEAWSYTKTFYRDAAEKGFGYAVARAMVNPYDSGYDRIEVSILTITFDKSGRVTGHSFSTAHSGSNN
jgi:outer membrane protein assembly factor BamE (lipoprotein component of BamABCDE complex)